MMAGIETLSAQLIAEYRERFGALVILDDIARVISYRIAKGRELVA
jgi:DNA uptake protein ComE-like DNA-binding protein